MDDSSAGGTEKQNQTDSNKSPQPTELESKLRQALDDLRGEATKADDRATRAGKSDSFFRGAVIIMGILAPGILAYTAALSKDDTSLAFWRFLGLFVAGIAGAGSSLRATFNYQESYRRELFLAYELERIANELESDAENAESKPDVTRATLVNAAILTSKEKKRQAKLMIKRMLIEDATGPNSLTKGSKGRRQKPVVETNTQGE